MFDALAGLIEAFHGFMDAGDRLTFIGRAFHVCPSHITGRNLSPQNNKKPLSRRA